MLGRTCTAGRMRVSSSSLIMATICSKMKHQSIEIQVILHSALDCADATTRL